MQGSSPELLLASTAQFLSPIKKKGKIILQTGYGPSGLPHIGTFGEVARTTMMINALRHIEKFDTELITFSDDMDGLRKVPDNIPNDEVLKKNVSCILLGVGLRKKSRMCSTS